jgi:hypothetical protein
MNDKQALEVANTLEGDTLKELKAKIRQASQSYKSPKRFNGIVAIRFGDKDIDHLIMDIVDAYRIKHGYSWKILFLRSLAEMAVNEGNTPLADTIVDYMINRKRAK